MTGPGEPEGDVAPTPRWVYAARPLGWTLVAWVAGTLPVLFGLASLLFADVDSSLSAEWAVAAISWGIAFAALAERAGRRETPAGPTAG